MELCHCPCVGGFQCLRSVIRNAIILKAGGLILWKYYHRELIMRTYMTLTTYRSTIHPERKSLIVQCDVRWWNKGRENLKKSLMISKLLRSSYDLGHRLTNEKYLCYKVKPYSWLRNGRLTPHSLRTILRKWLKNHGWEKFQHRFTF